MSDNEVQDDQFLTQRSGRAPKVIGLRDALIVCGLCTGIFGGITTFALRSMMREEIASHNNDSQAHPAAMKPVNDHISRQNGDVMASRELMDRVGRIEDRVNQSGESIARIEERLSIYAPRPRK